MRNSTTTGEQLTLRGVRENNLKSLDLDLPHNQLIAITGVSGSGKSTLAFDTIYAEGGRRYIETFSPYTRQFLNRLHRPLISSISGVRPALALEQRNKTANSRSTVGTVTEINDYLKVVWSQLALTVCPQCAAPVHRDTPAHVFDNCSARAKKLSTQQLAIAFPIRVTGEASLAALRITLEAEGFVRYYSPQHKSITRLEDLQESEIESGELWIVVDRVRLNSNAPQTKKLKNRMLSSIAQAYHFGKNRLSVLFLNDASVAGEQIEFCQDLVCTDCQKTYPPPRSSMFTFNSPLGACDTCSGFGKVLQLDPDLCVPDQRLSIEEAAIACWNSGSTRRYYNKLLDYCEENNIDTSRPWSKLSKRAKDAILFGDGSYKGVRGWFERLMRKRYKMHVRVTLARYRGEFTCPDCDGLRLKPAALVYRVNGHTLPEIWHWPLGKTLEFFNTLLEEHNGEEFTEIAIREVISRLRYLTDIGLSYLTLDRQSRTLSGGEMQRVNLTSILGARLVNTMLVLDEPTIGLHTRDTEKLIEALKALRDRGNTVFIVEHDQDVIRAADRVVDLGPLAGAKGGSVVFEGSVPKLLKCADSLTGSYLAKTLESSNPLSAGVDISSHPRLTIRGASANNLKEIDVDIPLECFSVITGVSGSGKSSLLTNCLYENYKRLQQGVTPRALAKSPNATAQALDGLKNLDDIVMIDQSPIGKTPRSNPATYTKAWDLIRECLADTPRAVELGLSKSAFSFNVDGGRCPECKGAGYHKIEMQFLADVFVECEDCSSTRFQEEVQTVEFAGKSVVDLLAMTLEEVAELFIQAGEEKRAVEINKRLQPLLDLGLGYLKLGQPLSNVSGGEAQRIKLASYLDSKQEKKCLFILDEPTTGLHPHNIQDLLSTFEKLIERGHSIICIEHNLDVIRRADWIIDLGPESGDAGGQLVACGSPAQLLKKKSIMKRSHTLSLLKNEPTSTKTSTKKAAAHVPSIHESIEVVGARFHNLKNISVDIPKNELSVVTGVSGSGKSTLAFDIVFAEGQRRYIDCLSPYARQYITQLQRAEVDVVNSIPPTVAISQKTAPPLGVSTIATTTEIYQYLRLLYSKVGTQHCPDHDLPITSLSPEEITDELLNQFSGETIYLFAPAVSGRKGYYNDLFQRALRAELNEARIDDKVRKLSPDLRLERHKLHWISLLVGSLKVTKKNRDMLLAGVRQCLLLGNSVVEISIGDKHAKPKVFSTERVCPSCKRGFRQLDPQDFSFRSRRGVCQSCSGRGRLEATDKKPEQICPECDGARIGPVGRHVYLAGQRISELTKLSAPELLDFLQNYDFDPRYAPVIDPIFKELTHLLSVITEIGLDYLQLDRESPTLSGGEAQRLRLARTLGSPLTGLCYVLDEPTIGLHPRDHEQLMKTLHRLRDAGNTLIVVEHDEETIRQADYIIDIGPRGGAGGGHIVASGSVDALIASENSLTGLALREREHLTQSSSKALSTQEHGQIELRGASTNNLKKVNARFPLQAFSVVAGVSGAGKSSLVHGTLVPAVIAAFEQEKKPKKGESWTWDSIRGVDSLQRYIEIDQSPVGKTSTSTPASYLGIFTDMRKLYALTPEAQIRGWSASHFSFNTGKGRCETCGGKGFLKVPMSFLPDAVIDCEACRGIRYNDSTLEIEYQGHSLGEILQRTMSEAREIFVNHSKIRRTLDYVHELGLGYLTLGQPTYTLSGGEAQRLKIAKELGSREAVDTLYILDEPTIGLHMVDVEKLLGVLRQLIAKGNTVVVIEHNLDVIRSADFLIELGPGPGESGGEIVFMGAVHEIMKRGGKMTPTRQFLREPIVSLPSQARHGRNAEQQPNL